MAFLFALASALLYGTADFFGGIAARRAPLLAVTLLIQAVGFAALVVAALATGGGAPPAAAWGWAAGAGVSGGAGVLLFYRALATGPISTAAPLISVVALCVPVAAGVFAGERPGAFQVAGMGLAAVAVAVISAAGAPADGGVPARAPRSALVLALLSGLLIGGFLVCLGRLPAGGGAWPLALTRGMGTATIALAVLAWRAPLAVPRAAWLPAAGCALLDVTANLCFWLAAARGALSLVATIVALAPASTVVLAQFALHERLSARQKAGVALALVAMVLLAQVPAH